MVYGNIVYLTCKHWLHLKCLIFYCIKTVGEYKCPLCRKKDGFYLVPNLRNNNYSNLGKKYHEMIEKNENLKI